MLLVGMDGQSVMGGKATGLGRYTQSLVDAFGEWGDEVRVKLYEPKGKKQKTGFKSSIERLMWEQFQLPSTAVSDRLDIFHQPCFSLPVILKIPRILTIHDLIIVKRPRYMSGFSRYYFSKIVPWSAQHADHIITNSMVTKRDVVKYLKIPDNKVTALELAPTVKADEFVKPDVINRFHSRFKLHNPYILYVGSFEQRKNIEALITQYRKVLEKYPEIKLVLAGSDNAYQEKVKEHAKKKRVYEHIVFTGYLNHKELVTAYRNSMMVVSPSLDEGFGLPIVEGMEFSKPVVASKIPAHIESAGGAAALFDPQADSQLGDLMVRVLDDEPFREELVNKGNVRAKQLSWSVHGRKTIELYYKVQKQYREKHGIIKKRKGHG